MTAARIRVSVPAETSGEDRLVGSLTFRHAAYLAVAAAGVTMMLLGDGSIPQAAAGAAVALVGIAGAVCRPYGEPLDRLAFTAMAYAVRRRRGDRADASVIAGLDDEIEEETPATPRSEPSSTGGPRFFVRPRPVVIRRVLVLTAVAGVAALATVRLIDHASAPAQEPRVVVVPIPVSPPDPWEEVDRALDEWLKAFAG